MHVYHQCSVTKCTNSIQRKLEDQGLLKVKAKQMIKSLEKADEMVAKKTGPKKKQTVARGRGKAMEFMRFR